MGLKSELGMTDDARKRGKSGIRRGICATPPAKPTRCGSHMNVMLCFGRSTRDLQPHKNLEKQRVVEMAVFNTLQICQRVQHHQQLLLACSAMSSANKIAQTSPQNIDSSLSSRFARVPESRHCRCRHCRTVLRGVGINPFVTASISLNFDLNRPGAISLLLPSSCKLSMTAADRKSQGGTSQIPDLAIQSRLMPVSLNCCCILTPMFWNDAVNFV
jgi:hypothetical protein